jgi:uncharacterized protein YecT (DUF1311 family)
MRYRRRFRDGSMIVSSRTNISERTRTCAGTDARSCSEEIDCSAGRIRCAACRLEQQEIQARKRAAIDRREKRAQNAWVTFQDRTKAKLDVRVVEGVSSLPCIGIARVAPTFIMVIREHDEWHEIDEESLDRRIGEKFLRYMERARKLMKTTR